MIEAISKLLKIVKAPSRIWMDYCGRNRHGQRPVLEENDIIWGQPVDPAKELASWKSEDIQSLQWARWRKTGGTFCRLLQETPFGATVKPETEGRYYENTSLNRQKKQEERNKRH